MKLVLIESICVMMILTWVLADGGNVLIQSNTVGNTGAENGITASWGMDGPGNYAEPGQSSSNIQQPQEGNYISESDYNTAKIVGKSVDVVETLAQKGIESGACFAGLTAGQPELCMPLATDAILTAEAAFLKLCGGTPVPTVGDSVSQIYKDSKTVHERETYAIDESKTIKGIDNPPESVSNSA